MGRILLAVATLALFSLPEKSQGETPTVVGRVAELILKYGDISETECGTKYKRRWKFCTSVVNLNDVNDEVREYVGAWECMRYLNDDGDHLNIVCLKDIGGRSLQELTPGIIKGTRFLQFSPYHVLGVPQKILNAIKHNDITCNFASF